uniref:C-type lectin domain-containing protein n=1 Tax=Panagrellus redivivus TaxID=6233 RepID=A0A7E4V3X6_PANRE
MRSLLQLFIVLLVAVSAVQCGELAKSTDIVDATTICGEGWFYSLELNGCYYVSTNYTTFEESVTSCEDIGGILVTVWNRAEYDTVSLFIEQEDLGVPYWIGLKPYPYYPYFRWLDNANANYTHWLDGIVPSQNDTETCFAWLKTSTDDGWLEADCNETLPFICKRHTKVDSTTNVYGSSGSVSSPNYPAPYYADSVSLTYIRVPDGYGISLTFDFLGIDANSVIYVIDNGVVINIITSQSQRPTVETSSTQLLVRFEASKEGNERYIGWKASFSAFAPISTEGSFNSPNYPYNYGNNERITKVVHVPDGYGILFTIWDFISEQCCDYLTISTPTEGTLLTLRGNNVTKPLTIRTNSVKATLFWFTDGSVINRGFNLTYVADPNWG